MTKDLEETLSELGPEYRAVVDRLVSAYAPPEDAPRAPARSTTPGRFGRMIGWSAAYLVAASLLVCVCLGVLCRSGRTHPGDEARPDRSAQGARTVNEFMLAQIRSEAAVAEMIRTQNPDGSWKTDYLTRQNAEALRLCASADAQVAYKKAMRNLRARQVL